MHGASWLAWGGHVCVPPEKLPRGGEIGLQRRERGDQGTPHLPAPSRRPSGATAYLLPAAVAAVSFAAVFARLAGEAPPFAIAFLRLAFAAALLTPVYISSTAKRSARGDRGVPHAAMALGAGFFLALHFSTWISSIFYTSVASSVLLVSTHPIFVLILGRLLLGEQVTLRVAAGIGLGLGGSALLAYGDSGLGGGNLLGDSLALVGGFGAACYFLIGRRLRQADGLIGYVYPVYVAAAVLLGFLCLVTKTPILRFGAATYGWILAMAVVCQVVGHTLLNWSLRYVKAYVVAVAVLAEPIGASLLAYLLLGEPPPPHFMYGAPVVLLGVFVSSYAESEAEEA
jgi:drug/metabolite transporter (DMT)-like permease